MHKTTEILALVTLVGAGVLVTGCGPVATGRDDGAFEPSREERVEGIAEQMCDRIEECGNIGEGGVYESYSECISDNEDAFYDLWPADECSDGQIDSVAYEVCYNRAQTYPCDANLFDLLSYLQSCSADDVCIDPRM